MQYQSNRSHLSPEIDQITAVISNLGSFYNGADINFAYFAGQFLPGLQSYTAGGITFNEMGKGDISDSAQMATLLYGHAGLTTMQAFQIDLPRHAPENTPTFTAVNFTR